MTSKGSRKQTRKPGSKATGGSQATGGRGHAAGPRVVANPSTLFQKMQPAVQLRSPLLPPIPSPGEEVLFDLHQRFGQGRAYDSIDELNREMRRLTMQGPVPRSEPTEPGPKAQRLMYDAWSRPEEGTKLAEEALAVDADCVDAYLFLAMGNADHPERAMEFAFKALEAGDQAVEAGSDAADEGHLWSHLPARPYLRARAFLARYVWGLGGRVMATTLAHGSLELDEGDALGLRYLLLSWYLDMGEEMLTRELLNKYKSDRSACLLYGDALLTFWDSGDDRTSKARLNKALKANPHVPEFLLGPPLSEIAVREIEAYGPGSEEEAWICAHLLQTPWERDLEAMEWLEDATAGRR